MVEPIEIVPQIRRLRLTQIGPWAEATLEFSDVLNLITKEGSSLGTSTILRGLVEAVRSVGPARDGLAYTSGCLGGKVEVEFRAPPVDPSATVAIRQPVADRGTGRLILALLRACLDAAPPNMAIIVADDVTATLDLPAYQEAVGLLNHAGGQVICVIAHRFRSKDFPTARVFSGACERPNSATIQPRSGE